MLINNTTPPINGTGWVCVFLSFGYSMSIPVLVEKNLNNMIRINGRTEKATNSDKVKGSIVRIIYSPYFIVFFKSYH